MTYAWIGRTLLCTSLCAAFGLSAMAKDAWKVKEELFGEFKGSLEYKKSKDVSGIACDTNMDFPRLCLVVDDETQGAQIVLMKEGELRAGGFIPLSIAQFAGEPVELDAEGVSFDGGYFYVVGSHGRARHDKETDPKKDAKKKAKEDAKAAASRQIFRIALPASEVDMETGEIKGKADITPSSALAAILQEQEELKSFYDKPLDKNGMTIEGVAVRDKILYIGMRGPVLGSDSIVLSVAESAVFDGQKPKPALHRLALGKDSSGGARGVRDLVRYRDGFLVLAGPENDPEDEETPIMRGDYSIYFWNGKDSLGRREDLDAFEKDGKKPSKPEALLPLDGDDQRVRVLLMFDGPVNGKPTPLEVNLK
jgi:hypothetical protein